MLSGKFSEIILPVEDVDAAIAQYEALGFTIVGQTVWGGVLLQRADIRIALGKGETFSRPALSFEVSGIFRAVESLKENGFTPQGEIADTASGDRTAHLLDKSGNSIFLWQTGQLVE